MKKVRLGLIGAGDIAQIHLKAIKGFDWIEAVGITSRTRSKAEHLAQQYEIANCYDSVEELMKDSRPDGLMVLVSEDQMVKVVSHLIPCELPLFIEKPPGLVPEETQQLVELAGKYTTPTMVGFNRRFYSIFHKGLQIIHDHGPLLGVQIGGHERIWRQYNDDGTPGFAQSVIDNWIYANSTHTIDLFRFFGGEPSNISALAHRYKETRADQLAAIMELESGAIGEYQAHWHSPGGWSVILYGMGATVEFKPLEKGQWTDKDFDVHPIEPDAVDVQYKPGFYKQMEAFGQLVRDGRFEWPMQDLAASFKTMTLAETMVTNVADRMVKI